MKKQKRKEEVPVRTHVERIEVTACLLYTSPSPRD